jgi:hypothetical protein
VSQGIDGQNRRGQVCRFPASQVLSSLSQDQQPDWPDSLSNPVPNEVDYLPDEVYPDFSQRFLSLSHRPLAFQVSLLIEKLF